MENAVAITLKRRTHRARFLRMGPPHRISGSEPPFGERRFLAIKKLGVKIDFGRPLHERDYTLILKKGGKADNYLLIFIYTLAGFPATRDRRLSGATESGRQTGCVMMGLALMMVNR